jgi:apolipoprotein D and lipocalin family protein
MKLPPLKHVEHVDLKRFMGPWYVISCTPTFLDKTSYNAIESYEMAPNGTINTTFSFYKGGFNGPKKTYRPKGFVKNDGSNAKWSMQFIWPIKADYQIAYLDDDYSRVIVARQRRDMVWLMAREPTIPEEEYKMLVEKIVAMGYKESSLRMTPQKWD